VKRGGKQLTLGDSLERLMARLDRSSGGGYQQARVALAWESVAGEAIAAHTTGAHVREGELVVFVDSSLWAAELSALSERYRVAVNEELGKELVSSVRFTVSRRVETSRGVRQAEQESEASYSADKVDPVPLSEAEARQVEASVGEIDDDELRDAVLRATVADLEWKKGLAARKDRETPRDGS
jgi:hypothetical protein